MSELLSILCPQCGRRSYNANDINERYCGFCHQWYATMHPRSCSLGFYGLYGDERSVILLAISRLAIERPRLTFFLGLIADRLNGRDVFDELRLTGTSSQIGSDLSAG
jgi:hypothetical protein